MPYREFLDSDGHLWNVWDVLPTYPQEAKATGEPPARQVRSVHGTVDQALARGWLCFQRGHQKRRLAPIPAEWERLPDSTLQELLSAAAQVHRMPAATDGDSVVEARV